MSEKSPLLPKWSLGSTTGHTSSPRSRTLVAIFILFSIFFLQCHLFPQIQPSTQPEDPVEPRIPLQDIPERLQSFQDCSVRRFISDTDLAFLSNARPPTIWEFVRRRDRLAHALVNDGIAAFAMEPGPMSLYYANFSQSNWGSSERPFIMLVQPQDIKGKVTAKTSFLVPSFEAERARLLQMALEEPIDLITYEEHWNYYSTLRNSAIFKDFGEKDPKVMVDEEMRDFVSRGLDEHGFDVVGLDGDVQRVRQTKSDVEIDIMRAVETGTVEALRAMRKCLTPHLTENDVRQVFENTLRAGGLDPLVALVLFDEDASNPHGGAGGEKKLGNETMVLIDTGARLYGYTSDVTRSFFPPFLPQPETTDELAAMSDNFKEKMKVWNIVFEAQTAAMQEMHQGSTAAAVDLAARKVIEKNGYGDYFAHRLGHGIGIQIHESPYLNQGNVNTTLKAGMTFTAEPGIYLVDKFGIRHEDVVVIKEHGLPDVLSGRRASDPWHP